jgi:sirohydrochlorin cobaltochelatase
MKRAYFYITILCILFLFSQSAGAMTRTLKKEPAIVIAAFGTTTKAQATYDFFEAQLKKELPQEYKNLRIYWAFTSEIVREKANKKFKEAGLDKKYLSLLQVLANLEDEGYRKIAVQPLHIFPGQEYEELTSIITLFRHLGLRISYGGTLLHKWPEAYNVIHILEKEFLPSSQGCTVLVAHGTPLTFPGSNSTYLGLDRYISSKYTTVFTGSVEGVLTREQALDNAKKCEQKKMKFIPFMYVAGDHIMNDIMGTEPDDEEGPSWAMEMKQAGFDIEIPFITYKEKKLYKGLGFYPEINRMFIEMLLKSLKKLES